MYKQWFFVVAVFAACARLSALPQAILGRLVDVCTPAHCKLGNYAMLRVRVSLTLTHTVSDPACHAKTWGHTASITSADVRTAIHLVSPVFPNITLVSEHEEEAGRRRHRIFWSNCSHITAPVPAGLLVVTTSKCMNEPESKSRAPFSSAPFLRAAAIGECIRGMSVEFSLIDACDTTNLEDDLDRYPYMLWGSVCSITRHPDTPRPDLGIEDVTPAPTPSLWARLLDLVADALRSSLVAVAVLPRAALTAAAAILVWALLRVFWP